jgi:hypothetical protein
MTAWSDHFEAEGHRLVPTSDDGRFTEEIYDLNEDRRIVVRRNRYRKLRTAITLIENAPRVIRQLLRTSERLPWRQRRENVEAAQFLRAQLMDAFQAVRRFRAIPTDAPTECRGAEDERVLPEYLRDQVIDVRAR